MQFQVEAPLGRVVYRGNNNANANGGVSYANANNDASNSNTNIGSRLDNNQRTEIGVQRWGRVPDAVPREQSLTKSGFTRQKSGHGTAHVPER